MQAKMKMYNVRNDAIRWQIQLYLMYDCSIAVTMAIVRYVCSIALTMALVMYVCSIALTMAFTISEFAIQMKYQF